VRQAHEFGLDMLDRGRRDHYRNLVGDMIVNYLTTPADLPGRDRQRIGACGSLAPIGPRPFLR
jgi:hypothetical protein